MTEAKAGERLDEATKALERAAARGRPLEIKKAIGVWHRAHRGWIKALKTENS